MNRPMDSFARRFVAFLESRRRQGEPSLWQSAFVYESLAEPSSFLTDPDGSVECLAVSLETLSRDPIVAAYLSKNDLSVEGDRIFDRELAEACDFLNKHVSVFLHSKEPRKMSIHVSGEPFGSPHRAYSLNFIKDGEYCLHVYAVDNGEKKSMLKHAFLSINS